MKHYLQFTKRLMALLTALFVGSTTSWASSGALNGVFNINANNDKVEPELFDINLTRDLIPVLPPHGSGNDEPAYLQTSYDITVTADPTIGGTVSGAGPYLEGASCTLTATANPGYTFTNWTENGTQVSTNATYTFTVTENADFVAHFSANTYEITATASPEAGGTVTGGGTYTHGETVTLTATPNPGYEFDHWGPGYEFQYFTIESLEDGNTITLTIGSAVTQAQMQNISYSTDNGITWNTTTIDNTEQVINVSLNAGEKVLWKGLGTNMASGYQEASQWSVFNSTKQHVVYGNIASLLFGDDFEGQMSLSKGRTYQRLFSNDSNLVAAEHLILPFTNLQVECYGDLFNGCSSLVSAPKLPAVTIKSYCYQSMFNGCSSLLVAPDLPATTLQSYCYNNMFKGCASLTAAPELPATTLANYCYTNMFNGCTSLLSAPTLPATTLANYCYHQMFQGCSSLQIAPALPATSLAERCYWAMFYGCSLLEQAPELPAVTLTDYCYDMMFKYCSSLANAPVLPAQTLTQYCYYQMFWGCSLINEITCLATDISATGATEGWLYNVASSGTFHKAPEMTGWATGTSGIPANWTVEDNTTNYQTPFEEQYFTIESLEDENTITLTIPAVITTSYMTSVSYSTDNGTTWNTTEIDGTAKTISVSLANSGDKVLFKGLGRSLTYGNSHDTQQTYFSGSKQYIVYGNIASLLYGDDFEDKTQFPDNSARTYQGLFAYSDELISAQNLVLPYTILAGHCYRDMFTSCDGLTQAPQLPATTLNNDCYMNMFGWCTSLTLAPELPAATLVPECYNQMFRACSSLTHAPELPAETLAYMCYYRMFEDCTALTHMPVLPATTLASTCYYRMFAGCTSLTKAPELPATVLTYRCYKEMFYGCTSLNEITCLATDLSETECTLNWLINVASTGTFHKASGMNDWPTGVSGIPSGWTIEDPEQEPAINLNEPTISFEVTESGLYVAYFNPIIAMQTFELVQGWNWWAPMVKVTAVQLQDSIGNSLVQIKTEEGIVGENIEPGEMYRIQTSAPCEVSLVGLSITPVEVSLAPGANWFGSICVEEKPIAAAISVEATAGDKIVSQNGGFAIYNGTVWDGTLTTLQPGCGYVYATTESKTLIVDAVGINVPTVTTSQVTNVTQTTATCGGNVTDDGGGQVTERGICWGTSQNPTISGSHVISGTGTGSYTVNMTGLTANTTYYVRAYATNSAGTAYGSEVSFTTSQIVTVPTVTTSQVTNITETGATGGGNVTADGNATVTERGICWGTSQNPTTSGSHGSSGTGTGSYTVNMTGLTANTTYYVRAYATNSEGTAYGNEVSFTTEQLPTYTVTVSASPSNGGSVNGGGTYQEGQSCTVAATASNGYDFVNWTENGTQVSTNASYTFTVTGNRTLVANFEQQVTLPTVTTNQVTDITQTTATCGGNVTNDGNATVTARGVCWSTSQNPTVSGSHTTNGTGTGSFTSSLTGLTPNTTYYVRAYATNSEGTAYGNEVSFTTLPLPTYTISVSASPAEGGTVTGGGTYEQGQSCTLTATANEGYAFVNWTENGNEVSTDATYTFTVDADRALVANFTALPTTPEGAIDGKFSINADGDQIYQIYFSQGNLQYIGSASTPYWKFADNQWDYLGTTTGQNSSSQNVDRDLFGWGTSGYNHGATCYQPWSTSTTYSDYYAYGSYTYNLYDQTGQADWGYNPISNGGNQANQWRTLTRAEWVYVFNTRTTASGIRFAKANVNNVNGVILLPDDWSSSIYSLSNTNTSDASYSSNTITSVQWATLEQAGAVFLPAAGFRNGASVYSEGSSGYYRSASYGNSTPAFAYYVDFDDSSLIPQGNYYRYLGLSVRLVANFEQQVTLPTVTTNQVSDITQTTATCGGTVTDDGGLEITARGVCWSTSHNPSLVDSHTTDGTGTGSFTSTLTGLTPNTTYYVRAYATNSFVTYGSEVSFTTLPLPTYTISVSASPAEGGTVTGGGTYEQGQSCTLTATANEVFAFVNWTENGNEVSTDGTYTFTVDADRALVANFTAPPTTPEGAIDGKFSINADGDQIYFSQGNLQYIGSASTPYWKFADNQWDYLGTTTGQNSSDQNVDRDLFGWGTSGYNHGANCYQPWSTSTSNSDYYAYGSYTYNLYDQTGQADWGYNPISNGGNQANQWRTLTTDEWGYVFNTRSTASGIRYAKAKVNNVNGVILLPDDWNSSTYSLSNTNTSDASYSSNTITSVQWATLEQAGAVFLPAAGFRNGASVYSEGSYGYYWSASYIDSNNAYDVYIGVSSLEPQCNISDRHHGRSVRLVANLPTVTTNQVSDITQTTATCGGTVTSDGGLEITARGVCWSTSHNPSLVDSHTTDGTGTGSFTSTVTGLTPNTTYYVRAYATNSFVTLYGSEVSFTTLPLPTYTISVSASPAEGGTVTGGGTYEQGQSCTLTATANEGYAFVNWTENGNEVSTDGTYTFTVDADRALVANFKALPTGAIDGKFSINADGDQIYFSQGNLQYKASTDTWRFATNQWDYVGDDNSNISSTYSGWIDLFGWGTSGYNHGATCYQPWSTSSTYSNYYAYGSASYNLYDQTGQADWGYNPISNGGNQANQWRTLTRAEWAYVFNTRSTASGIRFAKANVNNVNGVILLPDDWSSSIYSLNNTNTSDASYSSNTITSVQWATLEQAGAVFLPAAGLRRSASVFNAGSIGYYWSASYYNSSDAWFVNFGDSDLDPQYNFWRGDGRSVRLVAPLPTVTTNQVSDITQTTATCGGTVTSDGGLEVTARGVCWSTSQNPTVSGSHTTNGTGTGSFTSSITGLSPNTTYYVRAYATNSAGTAYGTQRSFTTTQNITQLTVFDGTVTDERVPVVGWVLNHYTKCEYVMPASHLSSMIGKTITSMACYSNNTSVNYAATFKVFIKEVSFSTISSFQGYSGATTVYEGSLSVTNGMLTIEFTTPFTYNGGNLLIGFYNISPGTGQLGSKRFYGVTATDSSVVGWNRNSLNDITSPGEYPNFLPKTTFYFSN